MADVHGLGDVRRTEINDRSVRAGGFLEKEMFAAGGGLQGGGERGGLEAEIEEARAGDFDFLANVGDIEFGDDIGGELARVHLALFGEGHERVGLVIAEFGVGTGADEHGGGAGVGQNGGDGGLQAGFDGFVGKHG